MKIHGRFSDNVVSALTASGWFPEREVPSDQHLESLSRVGYHPHERAISLYRAFFGLVVMGRGRLGLSFETIEHVANVTPRSCLRHYEGVSDNLSPFGSTSENVFLSDDGQILLLDSEGACLACFSSIERAMDVFLGYQQIAAEELRNG